MVSTDRISAFDVVLPECIPYKGQMLNQIAAKFLDATTDICPNWKMATPDPMVTVGVMCQGFPVEMIVRGYLCGSCLLYTSFPWYFSSNFCKCGISRWQGPHQVAQISIYTYFPLKAERETFLPDKSVQLKFGERAPTDNLRQRLHNVSKCFTNSGDFTYRSNTAQ